MADYHSYLKQNLKNRFKILEELGSGGMGVVLKAKDNSSGQIVALKILPHQLTRDPENLQRFQREARLLGKLQHQNILRVYEVGTENGIHFMSLEYLQGITFKQLISDKNQLSVDETITIIAPIVEALIHVHQNGIVHRDVKSANIFITSDGRPVLMDFGVAFAADLSRLSIDGGALGTPEYMSPEQALGNTVDTRSDVFSLGVVMYECLSGKNPFTHYNPVVVLDNIRNHRQERIREINTEVPEWLAKIVDCCLEKEKGKRPNLNKIQELLRENRIKIFSNKTSNTAKIITKFSYDEKATNIRFDISENQKPVNSLKFSKDGNILVSSQEDQIIIWDFFQSKIIRKIETPSFTGNGVITPDGRILISSENNKLIARDIYSGEKIRQISNVSVEPIDFLPDGRDLICKCHKKVYLWNIYNDSNLKIIFDDNTQKEYIFITKIKVSPHSNYIAIYRNNELFMYDINNERKLTITQDLSNFPRLSDIVFLSDDVILFLKFNNISFYTLFKENKYKELELKTDPIYPRDIVFGKYSRPKKYITNLHHRYLGIQVELLTDKLIMYANRMGALRIININNGEIHYELQSDIEFIDVSRGFKRHDWSIYSLSIHPSKIYAVTGHDNGFIKVWYLKDCIRLLAVL